MTNEQIAHDLAVARLHGSNLSEKELVAEYRKQYDKIYSVLKEEQEEPRQAKIMSSPF